MENININNNIPENEIETYENEIELYLSIYCEKYNIQDMSKETQNRWNGFLQFAGSKIFKGTNILKFNPNINNEYNKEYIYNNILPMYINLCNNYSKEISINGLSKLTWIDYDSIMRWSQESSGFGYEIYKKLMQENEQSNSDLLSSGKNPIAIIARLNHHHGWNSPYSNAANKQAQTATELPIFEQPKLFENGTQFIETKAT